MLTTSPSAPTYCNWKPLSRTLSSTVCTSFKGWKNTIIQIACSKPQTVRSGAEQYQQTHKQVELKGIYHVMFHLTNYYCLLLGYHEHDISVLPFWVGRSAWEDTASCSICSWQRSVSTAQYRDALRAHAFSCRLEMEAVTINVQILESFK